MVGVFLLGGTPSTSTTPLSAAFVGGKKRIQPLEEAKEQWMHPSGGTGTIGATTDTPNSENTNHHDSGSGSRSGDCCDGEERTVATVATKTEAMHTAGTAKKPTAATTATMAAKKNPRRHRLWLRRTRSTRAAVVANNGNNTGSSNFDNSCGGPLVTTTSITEETEPEDYWEGNVITGGPNINSINNFNNSNTETNAIIVLDEPSSSSSSPPHTTTTTTMVLNRTRKTRSCLRRLTQRDSLQASYYLGHCRRPEEQQQQQQHAALSSSSCPSIRSVTWGRVTFHYHGMILGDNPAVSHGHPVTLDWIAQESYQTSIDHYECVKPQPRRTTRGQLALTGYMRENILLGAGYSRYELEQTRLLMDEIRSQRRSSAREGRWCILLYRLWKGMIHPRMPPSHAAVAVDTSTNTATTHYYQWNPHTSRQRDGWYSSLTEIVCGGTSPVVRTTTTTETPTDNRQSLTGRIRKIKRTRRRARREAMETSPTNNTTVRRNYINPSQEKDLVSSSTKTVDTNDHRLDDTFEIDVNDESDDDIVVSTADSEISSMNGWKGVIPRLLQRQYALVTASFRHQQQSSEHPCGYSSSVVVPPASSSSSFAAAASSSPLSFPLGECSSHDHEELLALIVS